MGPFINPLKEILVKEYKIRDFSEDQIEIQTLFRALYNANFLSKIPLVRLVTRFATANAIST